LLLRCFRQAFVVANKFPFIRLVSGKIFRRRAQIIFDCRDYARCQVRRLRPAKSDSNISLVP